MKKIVLFVLLGFVFIVSTSVLADNDLHTVKFINEWNSGCLAKVHYSYEDIDPKTGKLVPHSGTTNPIPIGQPWTFCCTKGKGKDKHDVQTVKFVVSVLSGFVYYPIQKEKTAALHPGNTVTLTNDRDPHHHTEEHKIVVN